MAKRATTKKSSARKTTTRQKATDVRQSFSAENESTGYRSSTFASLPSFPVSRKIIGIALIILAIAGLLYYKKNWIIAATVNGAPISNFEVLNKLNKQYRDQTLSQMINERIILDEGKKKGIKVSPTEVTERIKKIEAQVGGAEALNGLLAQQRQTRADLQDQLLLQLTIEKLYANEATVSAAEIDEFIRDDAAQLQATEAAAQREEAKDIITQQKLSKIFNDKFQQLKQGTKIQIF